VPTILDALINVVINETAHLMLDHGVKPFGLKMKKISYDPVIGAKTGLKISFQFSEKKVEAFS